MMLFTVAGRYLIISFLFLTFSGNGRAENIGGVILEYSTSVNATSGNPVVETSVYIEISNPSYRNLADISISYRKGEKPVLTEACIIDKSGNVVRKIRKSDTETSSDISSGTFFSDEYKLTFSLYWHEYPYRIRYSYRKEITNYTYIARWTPYFHPALPVRSASLSVTVPAGRNVVFFRQGKFDADSVLSDGCITYNCKVENLPALKIEAMAPPLADMIPQVIVIPSEFRYEITGRLDSWQSYGQWYSELTDGLDQLTPEEKITANRLIQGISDKREIVKRLYYYLQDNTRYVNVSLETGGLKPFPATYVCKNKYGDCKALTVYMKALLKEAGIEAFYVHINAGGSAAEIIREAPGPQFNHMILCIPVEGDTLWIDNTATTIPFGFLDTGISGRTALLINGAKSRLVTTPSLSEADLINVSSWAFKLDESGHGVAELTMFIRGDLFHSLTWYRKNLGEKKLHDTISSLIPVIGAELKEWALEQQHRDSGLIILRSTLDVDKQVKRIGKYLVLQSVPPIINIPEPPEERKSELLIRYPIVFSDTISYLIPFKERFTAEIPGEVSFRSKFGNLEIMADESPGGFKLIRKISIAAGKYGNNEYESLYHFIKGMEDTINNSQIILIEK